MNMLATDKIITIGFELDPEVIIHPTSIAYIRTLLTPYAEAIGPAALDGIMQWIPLAIPGALGAAILDKVEENLLIHTEEVIKSTIILSLIRVILEGAITLITQVLDISDTTILPWDIHAVIGAHDDLSKMFGIIDEYPKLPVTVTIGPNQFTHMLTEEFTIGLLLFSDPSIGNVDFNITMFGEKFTSDYIVPLDTKEEGVKETPFIYRGIYPSRFIPAEGYIPLDYSVTIANRLYTFDTADFMQGFSTGALWASVDHHKYWKDLLENSEEVRTPLNF